VDQVGVNAPGRPSNKIDLSLPKSAKLYFLGGKPKCRSTLGKASPTEAKPARETCTTAAGDEDDATARRREANAVARDNILDKSFDMQTSY
jgi:hypothetical protein